MPYLTNETIFGLRELPKRLLVLGSGPIGCELAQAFRRFGSEVTIVSLDERLMTKEDPDASAIVDATFRREGIRLELGGVPERFERRGSALALHFQKGGGELEADAVLVATGRAPNVIELGLDVAGVEFDKRGVHVDDSLRTTNKRIFAAGDVASKYQFTHAADALARIALQNALFFGRKSASALTIPWCTYTDPEIAHVGMYEAEAKAAGFDVVTYTAQLEANDRAVVDGETQGFGRIHVERKRGRVLGATVVARHAGELIGEVALAVTAKLGIHDIGATILPYPTQSEVWKRLADAHNRTRLTPRARSFLERLLKWRR